MTTRLAAVDPVGCACTDCITGYSVPLDELNVKQVIKLYCGRLDNRTSVEKPVDIAVSIVNVKRYPDGGQGGTVSTARLFLIDGRVFDVTKTMQAGDLDCGCDGDCDCECVDLD